MLCVQKTPPSQDSQLSWDSLPLLAKGVSRWSLAASTPTTSVAYLILSYLILSYLMLFLPYPSRLDSSCLVLSCLVLSCLVSGGDLAAAFDVSAFPPAALPRHRAPGVCPPVLRSHGGLPRARLGGASRGNLRGGEVACHAMFQDVIRAASCRILSCCHVISCRSCRVMPCQVTSLHFILDVSSLLGVVRTLAARLAGLLATNYVAVPCAVCRVPCIVCRVSCAVVWCGCLP